jgi:hypothetical protein
MADERDSRPVAYCAPGRQLATALALILNGEDFTRVYESPLLERNDVILVTDPGSLTIAPPSVCAEIADAASRASMLGQWASKPPAVPPAVAVPVQLLDPEPYPPLVGSVLEQIRAAAADGRWARELLAYSVHSEVSFARLSSLI